MSSRRKKSQRQKSFSSSGKMSSFIAPGAGGSGRSRGTSFLQTEIKLSTTSYLADRLSMNTDMNEEGKKKLHRMFFKMMAMASSNTSSWYEKDEELLDEIDKIDNRRNTLFNRQASMSSGKSSSGKRRMENTGYIKLTTDQEKERLRNITMLLKIPYELNKMSLLGTAVSSNNMRTLRFFCKILKTYDENLRKEGEASTLSECLNMSNDMNHTPLMIAAESGYVDIINELVRLGADMTLVNKYDMNCLHLAVERNRIEAVLSLIHI